MWDKLEHLSTLIVVIPALWLLYQKIMSAVMKQIEEDRKKLFVLWREHGYNGWDGSERRGKKRNEREA